MPGNDFIGDLVDAAPPQDGYSLVWSEEKGWHAMSIADGGRHSERLAKPEAPYDLPREIIMEDSSGLDVKVTVPVLKKNTRPSWLKWYFAAFCAFELWHRPPHGIVEWIVNIFALMVVNGISWWLFPYCVRLVDWFPTVAKLKAENAHLIAENKKLCEKVSHDGAYR